MESDIVADWKAGGMPMKRGKQAATTAGDDGEAATPAWIESLAPDGQPRDAGAVMFETLIGRLKQSWTVSIDPYRGSLCLNGSGNPVKANPTRGDVRRLCAALGIELKPEGGGGA
jgi:hypothetical protein